MRILSRAILCALPSAPSVAGHAQAPAGRDAILAGYERVIADKGTSSELERLERLYILWEQRNEDPLDQASRVVEGRPARWRSNSPAVVETRRRRAEAELRAIRSVDPSGLTREDRLNYELFVYQAETAVGTVSFPWEQMPIYYRMGVHRQAGRIASMPATSTAEYEEILAWLRGVPLRIEEDISWMRRGLETGVVPPRVLVRPEADEMEKHLGDDPLQSPYLRPFLRFPESIPAAEQARLRSAALGTYQRSIRPAYQRLHRFFTTEYLPRTREDVSWASFPRGEEWYLERLRFDSSFELPPGEIHELGLAEVKRLRAEIDSVRREVGFEGTYEQFKQFVTTDAKFVIADSAALIRAVRDASKRAEAELFTVFDRLPRMPPAGVEGHSGGSMTTSPGSWEERRPAMVRLSPALLRDVRTWGVLQLAMWASYPGHHVADAWKSEMENSMPEFRRRSWFGGADHGWAGYATTLGEEMGLLESPYDQLGALATALRHSVQIVVETGMHHHGWTREQAADFARQNQLQEHGLTEDALNRMIAYAGTTHYRLGTLAIQGLREQAERELGDAFNLRLFHDAVLRIGMLPLPILQGEVARWIHEQKAGRAPAPGGTAARGRPPIDRLPK